MERIVDGMCFEGKRVENCFDVRTWTCNGVTERSARQVVEWREVLAWVPLSWDDYIAQYSHDLKKQAILEAERLADVENRRLRALKKSASRAKTMVRRFIISEGFNEMLTLTYRENQPDRELCKRHFGIWQKRMKRALGDFRYCAAFEVQERGSMHVHVATHRLPQMAQYRGSRIKAWQVGTRIWRDIVGANNGLCFVGGKTRFGVPCRQSMSLAKMAGYVSKYILKDYDQAPEESNRYSRSNGKVGGTVHVARLMAPMADLIACCFEVADGDVLVSHRVGYFRDSWWLCTESGPPDGH